MAGFRKPLIDELIEAYVEWREASAAAESAHRRWSIAPSPDTARRFAAYAAAVDREELTASSYARVIRQATLLNRGGSLSPER